MHRATTMTHRSQPYRPDFGFDILRVPVLGRLLRWRWGRLIFQLPLLLVAGVFVYDGFTGPQVAPENLATVLPWLHFRGFVVLGLLLFGNLFCLSCPFTLPRTLARRASRFGGRWPQPLRNKWVALGAFVGLLFLYEWLDLWASPWLTAWLVIAYFLAAFVLEALFAESPFCKYVCPLGTFNYVGSTLSPFQITVADREVCRRCPGKECVAGSAQTLGCGTELFPPQMLSNMDCILCLDCARACPYDNVALAARPAMAELTVVERWPRRLDLHFLVLVFAFAGVSNAFGMVPPYYELQAWLAGRFGLESEGVRLLLTLGALNLLLPAVFGLAAAWASRRLAASQKPLRRVFTRAAPAFVPLGFAIWAAHYGFHFATGALSVIPVTQSFLLDHGIIFPGKPDWTLSAILPLSWLLPLQVAITVIGLGASVYLLDQRLRSNQEEPRTTVAQLPWLALLLFLALVAIYIFTLPMEMRGTSFMN